MAFIISSKIDQLLIFLGTILPVVNLLAMINPSGYLVEKEFNLKEINIK
jgi:hypothetical protein